MSVASTPKYFIETANEPRRIDGNCGAANIREASPEEITEFMSKPCNHQQVELLVYDTPAYAWDIRRCAVCGLVIGMI